jgi:hypothetical protein
MSKTALPKILISTMIAGTMLAGVACSSSSPSAPSESAGAPAEVGSALDLSDSCPETVVIQTDWNPEAEHGVLYQMLGSNFVTDKGRFAVVGSLMAGDVNTGVNLEIRSGGPAVGYQTVTSQMYSDDAITLGYMNTDEAVQLSGTQPTLSVVSTLDKSPMAIQWDPASLPDVKTIEDLGKSDTTVLYYDGAAYMDYLLGAGILKEGQVDGSFDGTPARFVASQGSVAEQAYATSAPYIYQNDVPEWNGKPVAYELIHDTGFPIYAQALAIKPDNKDSLDACLKKLVPIVQQAQVDYMNDPAATNEKIVSTVADFNNGWEYNEGIAEAADTQMRELGIVSNGENSTLGDFDQARIQRVIEIMTPIVTERGSKVADGLSPETITTNEYVDTSITLN